MSIEIDILNGDASWPMAEPLFKAVWPPHVVEKLPWAGIVFAHADLRVLVQEEPEGVVCHVGIYRREVNGMGAGSGPAASAALRPARTAGAKDTPALRSTRPFKP
jgi:aminoglycoside 2'-N-acetyltransferase I